MAEREGQRQKFFKRFQSRTIRTMKSCDLACRYNSRHRILNGWTLLSYPTYDQQHREKNCIRNGQDYGAPKCWNCEKKDIYDKIVNNALKTITVVIVQQHDTNASKKPTIRKLQQMKYPKHQPVVHYRGLRHNLKKNTFCNLFSQDEFVTKLMTSGASLRTAI
ncbi:hypothetical protein HELRODRAFT_169198 [Helobdella robusta]|uniref:Uncharacterized protein n=1 Tax=Helobdella robusta TaxID=6412 RepID=T1F1K2_HELRO|nr:hypothetical protein HELRODRAFT_169198 [Helobdella robusta]ESO08378.1 hypothetical protein HELRODRAFT_169198 [Helobdella robusta]